jgi:hypothetical protein
MILDVGRVNNLVLEMARITRECKSEEELWVKAARAILGSFTADAVAILTYDPGFRSAYVASSVGKTDALLLPADITLRVTEGSSLAHAAGHPEKLLIVGKDSGDTVLSPVSGMTAAVAPMVYAGRVYGFLLLGCLDKSALLQNDADLVMAFSSALAVLRVPRRFAGADESEERIGC